MRADPKIDVWTIGIILFKLLTGLYPFNGKVFITQTIGDSNKEIIHNIINNEFSFPRSFDVSSSCKKLITQMLEKDPEDRICVFDVKAHPWFKYK